jgi:hypothetical protein
VINRTLDKKVDDNGKLVENGNFQFIKDLLLWITQEKSVFKLENPRHHFRNGKTQHGIYRIKDELVI